MQVQRVLDKLRRARIVVVAESSDGQTEVVREQEDADALTFFSPKRVYHQEILIHFDQLAGPLVWATSTNDDGVEETFPQTLLRLLETIDKDRQQHG